VRIWVPDKRNSSIDVNVDDGRTKGSFKEGYRKDHRSNTNDFIQVQEFTPKSSNFLRY